MGDVFVGYPPWGYLLRTILADVSSPGNYREYDSTANMTFHLGQHRDWDSPFKQTLALENRVRLPKPPRYHFCYRENDNIKPLVNPYWHQNKLNCIVLAQNMTLNQNVTDRVR
jgi:hypothetical protein